MTTAAVILAAILAIAAVLAVARPFLRRFQEGRGENLGDDAADLERLRLLEERDRALGALRELEFDHRTGKVSDHDYRRMIGGLRAEAAAVLSALSAVEGEMSGDVPVEAPPAEGDGAPTQRRS